MSTSTQSGDSDEAPQSADGVPNTGRSNYPASAVYFRLTEEFDRERTITIVSSGQACVHFRLSLASKDGDWIVREDDGALKSVLSVLARKGARYRLGAPLAVRWLAGGWSSHFEYQEKGLRVRVDLVSRPPRVSADRLAKIWLQSDGHLVPIVPVLDLIELKKTLRDRDRSVLGALSLLLKDEEEILRHSIAPRTLERVARERPDLVARWAKERPLLASIGVGTLPLRELLMQEHYVNVDADRHRIAAYAAALSPWGERWLKMQTQLRSMPLLDAHQRVVEAATGVLREHVDVPS